MLKIYRIVDNTNDNIYIGQTKQKYLCQRLAEHKSHKNCSSREILKNGDYRMELIEETDDPTRERYWVENTECINRIIPGRTRKEHYENNRDIILNKKKEYYENNKDKTKEYYENNKDKKKQYKKYINSMGGDPRYNNNLLKIYVNLFNLN